MTDKELLKLAAKAAGIELQWPMEGRVGAYPAAEWWKDAKEWNPLADDGDALRLAVKLGLQITIDNEGQCTYINDGLVADILHDDNPGAATRRAIVCAAVSFAMN